MIINNSIDPIAALIIVLALCMAGLTRFRSNLVLYGLQSIALGVMAARIGVRHHEQVLVGVGGAVLFIKGFAVPAYLAYAARRIGCHRETGMAIAPPLQLFLAIGGMSLLVLVPPFHNDIPTSMLPALGLLLLGMLLMITRRLAINQIIGFLVLENGIFLFTISQPHPMPLLVEIGSLMDVLAATMIGGLLVFRINRSFEHIDVTEMKELRG